MKATVTIESDSDESSLGEHALEETLRLFEEFDKQDRSHLSTTPDNPDTPTAMLSIMFPKEASHLYVEALKPAGHEVFIQTKKWKFPFKVSVGYLAKTPPLPADKVRAVINRMFRMKPKELIRWAEQQEYLKPL